MKKIKEAWDRGVTGWKIELKLILKIWSVKYPVLQAIQSEFPGKSLSFLEKIFLTTLQIFRCISMSNFKFFREDKKEKRFNFIEIYVLAWFFGFLSLLNCPPSWLSHPVWFFVFRPPLWIFIVFIVVYRLSDILSAQLGIIFIDRLKNGGIRSLNRSLLLLGINYFEIIVGFAIMYLATRSLGYSNCNNIITTPTDALYFSAVTITTLGCCDMKPISPWGMGLAALEPILGLIIIVLVIGAFFTFYARK
jgi:hypothetical protein